MQTVEVSGYFASNGVPSKGRWVADLVSRPDPRAAEIGLTDFIGRQVHPPATWASGALVDGYIKIPGRNGEPPRPLLVPVADDPDLREHNWLVRIKVVVGVHPKYWYFPTAGQEGGVIDVATLVDPEDYQAQKSALIVGVPGGVAPLGPNGLVPRSFLPSGGAVDLTPYATIAYVDQQDLHEDMPDLAALVRNRLT